MNVFAKNNKMLRALRICGRLTSVWPLYDGAGRLQVIFYKTLWWIYILNGFTMAPMLIRSVLYYRNDFGNMMKSLLELMYALEETISVLYCTMREKRFRNLLTELECPDGKRSSPYEEIVRRQFMFYARVVYGCATVIYIIGASAFVLSPLLLEHFPLNTMYPFPMSEAWAWNLVYALNFLSIWQAASVIQLDMTVITVLWNAAFKFKLVGMRMRCVFDIPKLRAAIDAHQEALAYSDEIRSICSFLVVKTMTIVFANTINCSLLIIHNVPLWEVVQFFSIFFISLVRFYLICWAAEMMTDMAYEVSSRIYDIPWMYATARVRRDVCMIMQRCQKIVTIRATSVIPKISIHFCGQVMSSGLSFFLTLRTILGDHI